jgi:hypothetical protein
MKALSGRFFALVHGQTRDFVAIEAWRRRAGLRGSEVALQVHRRSSGRENVPPIKIVG